MQVRDNEGWIQQRTERQVRNRLYPVIGGRGGGLLSADFNAQGRGPTIIDIPLVQHKRELLAI